MEVREYELKSDDVSRRKLKISIVFPELNILTEPNFNVYIKFENDLSRIPLIGIHPYAVSSNSSESAFDHFRNDFMLFKRDFLDRFENIKKNDILKIEFTRKLHDQLGVRFFFESERLKTYSDWYINGLKSCRTLIIIDKKRNLQVLNEQAYKSYVTTNTTPKTMSFECNICFDNYFSHDMVSLNCGHIFCKKDVKKLITCAICSMPKEPQFPLILRDGACPVDKCFNFKDLYILLPCCCVIPHAINPSDSENCPFTTCNQKIIKVQKLYFSK